MHAAAYIGAGSWIVKYPSFARPDRGVLRLRGDLAVVCLSGACWPAVSVVDETTILDPRAIITNAESGRVLYGPSSIPRRNHDPDMAEWVDAHPDWESEHAPGGVPTIPLHLPGDAPPTIVLDHNTYAAPRVGTRPQNERQIRRAHCGHDVYVSDGGLDAIKRQGKQLICGPCVDALASEPGRNAAAVDAPLQRARA